MDAAGHQTVDLRQQSAGVDHHAGSNDTLHVWTKDPAGNQGELVGLPPGNHRVSGICPPLVADHIVSELGIDINDLPFSLVAPLGAHHYDIRHYCLLCIYAERPILGKQLLLLNSSACSVRDPNNIHFIVGTVLTTDHQHLQNVHLLGVGERLRHVAEGQVEFAEVAGKSCRILSIFQPIRRF